MFGFKAFGSEKITDFEYIRIHLSGMRSQSGYEIHCRGSETEILHYSIRYRDGEECKEPESIAVCATAAVLNILNECGFLSWDGFHGRHPRRVKDGVMFRLEASVNGGRLIKAGGSENFPKHFQDLMGWIKGALR